LGRRDNALAKALTHFSGVVALGYFVEVDRFADCRRSYRRILVTDWVRRQRFELAI
jgi:hypothetical protein